MHLKLYILLVTWILRSRGAVGRKLVDLTHTLDSNAPKWPLTGFLKEEDMMKNTKIVWTRLEHFWVAVSYMEYYEHMGTHIDAPIHTAEGRSTFEQIPVHKLMGPGVVFNIKQKAEQNPDYGLTVADIEEYEAEFGRIPDGAIVVINTGWGLKYPRPDLVFGTQTPNDSMTFHFPGYTLEAAKFLLTKRSVLVVGSDAPSVDFAIDHEFKVHVYFQSHEVPLMEYVANLDIIPQNGTTIFLGAPKFRDGTGGPTRAIAIIDNDFYASSGDMLLPCLSLVKSFLLQVLLLVIILDKTQEMTAKGSEQKHFALIVPLPEDESREKSIILRLNNSLKKRRNFGMDQLTAVADEKLYIAKMRILLLGRVENVVGKGEHAGYQHFLLFPQCFQKQSS